MINTFALIKTHLLYFDINFDILVFNLSWRIIFLFNFALTLGIGREEVAAHLKQKAKIVPKQTLKGIKMDTTC